VNLYLLKRTDSVDYDEYDSCVVAAESEAAARLMHPDGYTWDGAQWLCADGTAPYNSSWTTLVARLDVTLVGAAAPGVSGVVCSSFNAG
jgi:hypothetical protein